jgi:hypothetical protein
MNREACVILAGAGARFLDRHPSMAAAARLAAQAMVMTGEGHDEAEGEGAAAGLGFANPYT